MMKPHERLREWRVAEGLTQGAAAERVGVGQPAWCRLEAGSSVPQMETALRIAQLVGIPLDAWPKRKKPQARRPRIARAARTGTEG
jgi:transcriptional regulator with XRE-family HTH domain